MSHPHIEHELGMRPGSLDSILAGQVELQVAHVFAILQVIGLDLWKFLALELREEALEAHVTRIAESRHPRPPRPPAN